MYAAGILIYLSERAAMISTAAQTRISGFKEGQDGTKFIQEYVKSKLPNLGKISVTKNGPGTYVTSFASAEDAKKAAKAFWLKAQGTRGRWRPGHLSLESKWHA